ncbi:DUF523 domain-containing protein [Anaerococcus degeneri]|uniref:DUF523 domain-containing protein n=1 Tax=Anaerococcus degeneri TaxID=361500 RepID=A0ABS7YWV5_9FIRM|nr:DUF523 domain-containing protein [Anaerococcus degeneri]MBP2015169.1 uncharacterized protein YbbK (DUF523 family) [Anaerococcus degeneri]MCA2095428.1 DUF523 domain-containing protein [Anaerococcus degeneri]
MKIAVSACLLGENCKYNGGNNYSYELGEILEKYDVIPICPEVMGGLPTPRTPAEVVNGVVLTKEGRSVDAEFKKGAEIALDLVKKSGADLVVLQSRSPSCGVGVIYDGSFSGKLIEGNGIFVKTLNKEGIKAIDVEEFIKICQ